MIARLRAASRGDEGASALEFALIGLFIVVPLVFGAISFGLVFAGNLATSNAARQGARLGTVIGGDPANPNDCGDIVTETRDAIKGIGASSSNLSVQVIRGATTVCATNGSGAFTTGSATVVPCDNAPDNTSITVYARSYTPIFFIPPYYFKSNGYPLEGKGVYRCEFR